MWRGVREGAPRRSSDRVDRLRQLDVGVGDPVCHVRAQDDPHVLVALQMDVWMMVRGVRASATLFTKATARLKPLNVNVLVRASSTRAQPLPLESSAASPASSRRVSFSGVATSGDYLYAFRTSRPIVRYPHLTKTL